MPFDAAQFISQSRQAGISDDQTLAYLQSKNLMPNQAPQEQQGNNFFQNLITDPLKTLLVQPVVRTIQAGQALAGDQTAGLNDVNLNLGPLGHLTVPGQKTGGAGVEQIAGDAFKTAAYLTPGLGEGTVAAQAGKNFLAGGAFGAGQAMQDNATLPEVLEQGLLGGAIGAGSSLGLSALSKGASAVGGKFAAPFAEQFNNDAAQVAEKYGIKLPASSLTDSNIVKNMEALAAKGPFGRALSDMVTEAGDKINNIADDLVNKAGSTDLLQGGQDILSAQTDFQKTWVATKNALYETAKSMAGETPVTVDPNDTIKFLQSVLGQKQLAAAAGPLAKDASFFKEFLDKLERLPEKPQTQTDFVVNEAGTAFKAPKALPTPKKPVTLQEAQAALKELNEKLANSFKSSDPIITGNLSTLRRLAATLSSDIDKAMPEDIKLAAAQADAYYKQGLQKLNSTYGKKIKLYENQPDKIIPAIMNRNTSLAEIPQVLSYVGPQNADNIRANVLESIVSGAKSATTDEFTTGGLTKQINKFGEDKLQALLKPEQFTALKDLEVLAKALQGGQNVARGSQTGFLNRTVAEIGAAFIHPLFAIKAVVGDAIFSKFISSAAGQRLLQAGYKAPAYAVPKVISRIIPSQIARAATQTKTSPERKVKVNLKGLR